MSLDYNDFVHPNHLMIFVAAATEFSCHILIRKTGRATIKWVDQRGYTGKRADMKAKTADVDFGSHPIAGLVCSPILRPDSFTPDRLKSARECWHKSAHLVSEPPDSKGFDDDRPPKGCRTPYIVQTNPDHKHYGCIALVDMGLLVPRYVHGDYDLYAIIPANKAFNPNTVPLIHSTLGSTMSPPSLSLREKLSLQVPNVESPLSFQVANFINVKIAGSTPDLLGSLMVNHGEQVNIGAEGQTFEPVLAIMPRQVNGQWGRILCTRQEHEQLYSAA